jgi:hypothetical protein
MLEGIDRRAFLWLLGASGAAVGIGGLWGCRTPGTSGAPFEVARFFTPRERRALEALAAAIVPEDETVGALGAGAVEYIDRFLASFDARVPALFRAGPFSDRNPYPDSQTGRPGSRFPANAFLEVLPATRLQLLAFRALIEGPGAVPGTTLTASLLPAAGLRGLYRTGIAGLEAAAVAAGAEEFAALDDAARLAAFDATPREFQEAVLSHLAEGMFGAPEYGGNRNTVAWRDYHYGGDSQPLGYSIWDASAEQLRDHPQRPNQTLDPSLPNDGFDPEVLGMLELMVQAQGGKRYF